MRAVHDPGKVLLDVATGVAFGGDCLADVAAVRAQPAVFGSVASDRTVSRIFTALAGDVETAVAQSVVPGRGQRYGPDIGRWPAHPASGPAGR